MLKSSFYFLIIAYIVGIPTMAHAQSTGTDVNKFLSNTGTWLYLGAGVARPLLRGRSGWGKTLRTSDALITSVAFAEGIKLIVQEKRPDGDGKAVFSIAYATAAFAVAAVESHYHPKEAPYWYLGATLIAESRVGLHRHYIHDVLAGATIGYFTAQWELRSHSGLILAPILRSDTGEKGVALALRY